MTELSGADKSGTSWNSFLYLLGALAQGFGLVIVQPFTLGILSDLEWGKLAIAVSTLQVGVVVTAAGLPFAITRAYFDPGDGQQKARSISGFLSLTGFGVGLVVAISYALFEMFAGVDISWHYVIAILVMGMLATVLGGQAILRAAGRPIAFIALSIGVSLGANLSGLISAALIGPTATSYISGYAVAVAVAVAASLLVAPVRSPRRSPAVLKEALQIGLPILPHSVALLLLSQGVVLLLAATVGPTVAGDFAKVQIFALAPITLLAALNNSWVPHLMSATEINLLSRLRITMSEASLIAFAIVLLAVCGANIGTRVLARGDVSLIPVAQILPLVALGYVLYLMSTTVLFRHKRTRSMAIITPIVVASAALVAYAPARDGRLEAVAAIVVLAYLALGATYFLVARRLSPVGWPMRQYLMCLIAALLVSAGVSTIPDTLPAGILVATLGLVSTMLGFAIVVRCKKGRP